MTSTLENLLSRFYCAPAEACMRSGEDDEAKNFENLYFRFGEKDAFISEDLRCVTSLAVSMPNANSVGIVSAQQ